MVTPRGGLDKNMPPKSKRAKKGLDIGHTSEQGQRDYNEDRLSVTTFKKLKASAHVNASAGAPALVFTVYDGHGGHLASTFSQKHYPVELKTDLEAGLAPVVAMVNAVYATEVQWFRESSRDDSGTTLVSVLLDQVQQTLYVANVGDSRALLVRATGSIVALTQDQDGSNKTELRRIKAAGGFVDRDNYVNGTVQTARSIGDADAKFPNDGEDHTAAVVPTPVMLTRTLASDDMALVLACDGLFESHKGSHGWINMMVRSMIKNGSGAKEIATALVVQALDDGSEDNTTAIVVLL